jgi:hypothetical protein
MTPDQPGIDGGSGSMTGRSTSKYKSSVTRSPAARIDGRSAAGKRIRDLFRALADRLGNPDDIVAQADILCLAELKVMAEAARLRILEGKDQNTNGLIRLENMIRRSEVRVGLEPGDGAKVNLPDWRDLLTDEEDEDQPDAADDGVTP